MEHGGAATLMKRKPKTKVGRPKASEPLRSLVSLKGSGEFEAWLDGLVDHARQGTRTLLMRNALFDFAKAHGYTSEMPRR